MLTQINDIDVVHPENEARILRPKYSILDGFYSEPSDQKLIPSAQPFLVTWPGYPATI